MGFSFMNGDLFHSVQPTNEPIAKLHDYVFFFKFSHAPACDRTRGVTRKKGQVLNSEYQKIHEGHPLKNNGQASNKTSICSL